MITVEPVTHIHLDERGVAWVDDTNTKVKEIVLDKLADGSSPEEMHEQHPHLSLAQIHAALAYYYDHRETIDAQIAQDLRDVEGLRGDSKQPSRKELEARLKRA